MDDPWGSPWAADPAPPTLDLPAAPPHAHISSNARSRSSSRVVSPHGGNDGEDDAWGGWNDAASGKASPAWGRSPGLKPLGGWVTRQSSPDPWGTLETEVPETEHDVEGEKVLDSEVSLEHEAHEAHGDEIGLKPEAGNGESANDGRTDGIDTKPATPPNTLSIDIPERSQSPEGMPTKAIGVEGRPEVVRQASKVQELVVMYDGIARKSTSPVESPYTHPKDLDIQSDDRKAEDDQTTENHQGAEDGSEETDADLDEGPTVLKSLEMQDDDDSGLGSETVQAKDDDTISQPRELAQTDSSGPPPVPYKVDLSNLDALFPSTPATTAKPEPVPDVIIDDTFTSIEERKAWYRISRFGSMRKHNLGNDENYVRATWHDSEIRDRTIRIVRRWMEEDSITGRVVLGRRAGAVGAAMFGWDSAAPQVDVGELLGRKGRHSRQVSVASKATTVSPTAVAFGWSSSPASPVAPVRPVEEKAKGIVKPPMGAPSSSGARESIQVSAQPLSLNQALAAPKPANDAADEVDDDDDWGEMVSSPTFPPDGSLPLAPSVESTTIKTTPGPSPLGVHPPEVESMGQSPSISADISNGPTHQPDPWASANLDLLAADSINSNPAKYTPPPMPTESRPSSAFRTTTPALIPPAATPSPSTSKMTARTAENGVNDDEAVAKILRDLPDLSYMFR